MAIKYKGKPKSKGKKIGCKRKEEGSKPCCCLGRL
jgi:hypothetical protein